MPLATETTTDHFKVDFPGFDSLVIRPVDVEADAADIHDWVNRDYAWFWGMQGKSLDEVRRRYGEVEADGKSRALIATRASTGEKIALLMYYWTEQDELGARIGATSADRGCHIFLAPEKQRVSNLAFYVMVAVQHYVFSDPSVMRLIHQPDIGNEKVIVRLMQAGYAKGRVIHLSHKTCLMMYMTRGRFMSLDRVTPPAKVALSNWPLKARLLTFAGRVFRKLGLAGA